MSKRNLIIASVIGVIFLFAGFNLYSYFKEQQAIQAAEDLRIEQRQIAREAERQQKAQELEAQRIADREVKERARLAEAARLAELEEQREEARLKAEAEAKLREAEQERARAAQQAKQLAARTQKARTLTRVPEIRSEILIELSKLSPRYAEDHPEEFLNASFGPQNLSSYADQKVMVHDGTTPLMLYAVIAEDTKLLETLIDIGLDVNATNEGGFSPLMFAAAYGHPDIARFLIEQGADIKAKAYVMDLNALHLAALRNPEPNMIDVLLDAGLPIESPALNGYTPILLAATDTQNLEVVETLITRGADIGVYDQDGASVHSLVQNRINRGGDRYISISDEVNARILQKLAP